MFDMFILTKKTTRKRSIFKKDHDNYACEIYSTCSKKENIHAVRIMSFNTINSFPFNACTVIKRVCLHSFISKNSHSVYFQQKGYRI